MSKNVKEVTDRTFAEAVLELKTVDPSLLEIADLFSA